MEINQLIIANLTPFSTIDFPNQLATVLFCQGCTWRCGYCHNPHLLTRQMGFNLSWKEIERFLQSRQNLLDAVVFSGGEPTLQKGLLSGVQRIKQLGFKVGLHTAGIRPNHLLKVLPELDWVGFDIKAPVADYAKITGSKNSGHNAVKSAHYLLDSGVDYEFRTTIHPLFFDEPKLLELATQLAKLGVKRYFLQSCRTTHCLDKTLSTAPRKKEWQTEQFLQKIRAILPVVKVSA